MRFLLVDDHSIVRVGVRQLIEREWPQAEVDEAESIADAAIAFAKRRADFVVLDLSLPDAIGIEGVRKMHRIVQDVPILVLSQNDEAVYAARVMRFGVRGYLTKDHAGTELITALRRILAGGRYVSESLSEHLLALLEGDKVDALPHEKLSTQEFRIVELIADGRTPAQIAETMHLSVKTVGSYRARIFAKTSWTSNAELTRYCVHHGLTKQAGT